MTEQHEEQDTRALAPIDAFRLPDLDRFETVNQQIEMIRGQVQKHLKRDVDYGVIEGTERDTLYKTGAEKIAQIFLTRPEYEIEERITDWEKGLFAYEYKCSLISLETGKVVAQGVGECNTFEPKYFFRNAGRECPNCGEEAIIKGKEDYGGGWLCWRKRNGCGETWVDNTDQARAFETMEVGQIESRPADRAGQRNTVKKLSKKRSLVDAALGIGALSAIFTQDMEDDRDPAFGPTTARVEPKPQTNGNGHRKDPDTAPKDPAHFQNAGHLMTAATHRLGMTPREIVGVLGVDYPSEIDNPEEAWYILVNARQEADSADVGSGEVGAVDADGKPDYYDPPNDSADAYDGGEQGAF